MDFSTIKLQTHADILALLRPALTSAAGLDERHLICNDHVGDGLIDVSRQKKSQSDMLRMGMGLHTHVWHEICLQLAGESALETQHGVHRLDPPAVAVLSPGMIHCERRVSSTSTHAMLWISLGKNHVWCRTSVCRSNGVWDAQPLQWSITGRSAAQTLAALPEDQQQPYQLEPIRLALVTLISDIYRQALYTPSVARGDDPLGHHHLQMLRELARFIEQHLDRPIRLEQLASVAHLSPNHLNMLFRKWTGLPVHAWIVKKRMDKAMTLLQKPGTLAKQAALQVGYTDPLYFSRAFHKHFGRWPSQVKHGV